MAQAVTSLRPYLALLALGATMCLHAEEQSDAPRNAPATEAPSSVFDFKMPLVDGKVVDLKTFKNKVLMIVNVASQ